MGEFRFKKFTVVNEKSAMKVNTDGVLLGALMTLSADDRILLDVGTGTGTVSLMAAQRLDGTGAAGRAVIHAIDIDTPSAEEAGLNFSRSPWPHCLKAWNMSLQECRKSIDAGGEGGFPQGPGDLVFSNPPYFDSTLRSPDLRRREARHSGSLSYRDLLEFSAMWLGPEGRCSVILPADTETDLCRHARMCGLFLFRIVRIRTVPSKPPRRIVAEFSRHRVTSVAEESLTIQDRGRHTEQYTGLTYPFYLDAGSADRV